MRKSPGSRPRPRRPNHGATAARMTSTTRTVSSHFNMIELYTWSTPNGRKVSIMLEECGLPYRVHRIDIGKGDQFTPEYLAGKTGKFLARTSRGKYDALQWLMFQMGGVGPTFGQAHHFMRAKKDEIPYGSERYGKEAKRLYAVMDRHLTKNEYFSEEYSIADIAIYPWVARHEWHRVDLADYPNVKGWYEGIGARPAVARGMAVPPLN